MTERLNYGLDHYRVFLDAPNRVVDRARYEDGEMTNLLSNRSHLIDVDRGLTITRLCVNNEAISNTRQLSEANQRARQVVHTLDKVARFSPLDQRDPNMAVVMESQKSEIISPFFMWSLLRVPDIPDDMLSEYVAQVMRRSAQDIYLHPKRLIDDEVGVSIDGHTVINIEVAKSVSAGMKSDEYEKYSSDELVTLRSHNLTSHLMQLVCLSGLIAVAKA